VSDPRLKADIFAQKVPCDDCPFRKKGGVRHTPEMLASYISYFINAPGATFPCHKSVNKTDDREGWSEWKDGQVLCAGGLIFAAKLQRENGVTRLGKAKGWYDPAQHTAEEKALVFDSVRDMLKYQYRPVMDKKPDEMTIRERAEFLAHEIFEDVMAPEEEIADAIEVEIRRFARREVK